MVKEHLHYFGGQKVFFCKKSKKEVFKVLTMKRLKKSLQKFFKRKNQKLWMKI